MISVEFSGVKCTDIQVVASKISPQAASDLIAARNEIKGFREYLGYVGGRVYLGFNPRYTSPTEAEESVRNALGKSSTPSRGEVEVASRWTMAATMKLPYTPDEETLDSIIHALEVLPQVTGGEWDESYTLNLTLLQEPNDLLKRQIRQVIARFF